MGARITRRAAWMIEQSRAAAARCEREMREEDLADLLILRYAMATAIKEADRILVAAITDNIRQRLADEDADAA